MTKRKYKPCKTMEIEKGIRYITSTPGILKIVEFISLLISLACIGEFIKTLHNTRGTWTFFAFSVAITCLLTITAFLFFMFGGHKKFSSVNWVLLAAIAYFIFTILLLVAAGILADNTRSYKTTGVCDSWTSVSQGDIECNNLVVAVIFGFAAFVLYSLDTIFHFWLSVVAEPEANEEETTGMKSKEQETLSNDV